MDGGAVYLLEAARRIEVEGGSVFVADQRSLSREGAGDGLVARAEGARPGERGVPPCVTRVTVGAIRRTSRR